MHQGSHKFKHLVCMITSSESLEFLMICNSCVFFAVGQIVILYRKPSLLWLFEVTEIKNGIVKFFCAV